MKTKESKKNYLAPYTGVEEVLFANQLLQTSMGFGENEPSGPFGAPRKPF